MDTIKSILIEQQATIENAYDILKQAQMKILQQGEKFLEKYTNDNIGISLLDEKQLNLIMSDLQIVEEIDNNLSLFTIIFHKVCSETDEEKYRILYCHPDKITPCIRKVGLAYVIGNIMFTDKLKRKIIELEFPSSFSQPMDSLQQAFTYSLIIPYIQYRHYFIEFLTKQINNVDLKDLYIQIYWIQYLGSATGCDLLTASAISNFYSTLYFDELQVIWNNYIQKALNYNYIHPSSPYQVPTTSDDVIIATEDNKNKQKHIQNPTS